MRFRSISTAAGAALAPVAAIWMIGCDVSVDSAATLPVISPTSVTISKGQSIEFTASQGYDYLWAISADHRDWGNLSANTGDRTTYTSMLDPAEGVISVQVLTLTSFIQGGGGQGGSSSNAQPRTAEAYIKHIRVAVSPKTVALLTYQQSVTFTASSGSQYNWSVLHPEYGQLSATNGPSVTYTSTLYSEIDTNTAIVSSFTQVVTVRSFESEATATITQR